MLEAYLAKLIINEKSEQQIMILKEKEGNRILPVIISIFEAVSIDRALRKIEIPRPLTHDLLYSVIIHLQAAIEFIEITSLKGGTYFGNLHLKNSTGIKIVVDCRPSDAVAIAVRAKCPIMIQEDVLEQAGEIDPDNSF